MINYVYILMVLACNYQKNCCFIVFLSKFGKRTLPLHCGMVSSLGQDLSCRPFLGGGSFDSTQNHRNLLRSSSKFFLETTPKFVRMECSSFLGNPRSSKRLLRSCRWRLHRRFKVMVFDAWPFWAFHHAGVSDTSQSYFSSLQEASLQTLGVDMCEDMTELEFLHNELAWTLNASCDLRLGFVLDIHNLVLVEGFFSKDTAFKHVSRTKVQRDINISRLESCLAGDKSKSWAVFLMNINIIKMILRWMIQLQVWTVLNISILFMLYDTYAERIYIHTT